MTFVVRRPAGPARLQRQRKERQRGQRKERGHRDSRGRTPRRPKDADVRDIGLPVYPGARRKEKSDDGDENSAHVNISTSLFGIKVVAIEYLSDDPPEKLVAYYKDQLKKYGNVLECHTNKVHTGTNMDFDDTSGDSKKLKCDDDQNGKTIELKVGTEQNQHIVSIKPGGRRQRIGFWPGLYTDAGRQGHDLKRFQSEISDSDFRLTDCRFLIAVLILTMDSICNLQSEI